MNWYDKSVGYSQRTLWMVAVRPNVCMVAYVKLIRQWNLKGARGKELFLPFSAIWKPNSQYKTAQCWLFVHFRPTCCQINIESADFMVKIPKTFPKIEQNCLKPWHKGLGLLHQKSHFQPPGQSSKYLLQGSKFNLPERPRLILYSCKISLICNNILGF